MVELINRLEQERKESELFDKIKTKAEDLFKGFDFSVKKDKLFISIQRPGSSDPQVEVSSYMPPYVECHDKDLHNPALKLAQYCEKISNKKFRLYTNYEL